MKCRSMRQRPSLARRLSFSLDSCYLLYDFFHGLYGRFIHSFAAPKNTIIWDAFKRIICGNVNHRGDGVFESLFHHFNFRIMTVEIPGDHIGNMGDAPCRGIVCRITKVVFFICPWGFLGLLNCFFHFVHVHFLFHYCYLPPP